MKSASSSTSSSLNPRPKRWECLPDCWQKLWEAFRLRTISAPH